MCTVGIVPELIEAGINSFKIEGRMKSAYYTAVVTNAYRMAMDAYTADPEGYAFNPEWLTELESVSHRTYGTGFYLDDPMNNPQLLAVSIIENGASGTSAGLCVRDVFDAWFGN